MCLYNVSVENCQKVWLLKIHQSIIDEHEPLHLPPPPISMILIHLQLQDTEMAFSGSHLKTFVRTASPLSWHSFIWDSPWKSLNKGTTAVQFNFTSSSFQSTVQEQIGLYQGVKDCLVKMSTNISIPTTLLGNWKILFFSHFLGTKWGGPGQEWMVALPVGHWA